jgi:hypothetical protein
MWSEVDSVAASAHSPVDKEFGEHRPVEMPLGLDKLVEMDVSMADAAACVRFDRANGHTGHAAILAPAAGEGIGDGTDPA